MGCGSTKASISSVIHTAVGDGRGVEEIEGDDEGEEWDKPFEVSRPSYLQIPSIASDPGPNAFYGQDGIRRIISADSDFSSVTGISGSSRIRVTLSSDGSLLQVETERLDDVDDDDDPTADEQFLNGVYGAEGGEPQPCCSYYGTSPSYNTRLLPQRVLEEDLSDEEVKSPYCTIYASLEDIPRQNHIIMESDPEELGLSESDCSSSLTPRSSAAEVHCYGQVDIGIVEHRKCKRRSVPKGGKIAVLHGSQTSLSCCSLTPVEGHDADGPSPCIVNGLSNGDSNSHSEPQKSELRERKIETVSNRKSPKSSSRKVRSEPVPKTDYSVIMVNGSGSSVASNSKTSELKSPLSNHVKASKSRHSSSKNDLTRTQGKTKIPASKENGANLSMSIGRLKVNSSKDKSVDPNATTTFHGNSLKNSIHDGFRGILANSKTSKFRMFGRQSHSVDQYAVNDVASGQASGNYQGTSDDVDVGVNSQCGISIVHSDPVLTYEDGCVQTKSPPGPMTFDLHMANDVLDLSLQQNHVHCEFFNDFGDVFDDQDT